MKNRLHLDVVTSDIPEAAEQAQALGAERVGGIHRGASAFFQVLFDPEGNEWCLERARIGRSGVGLSRVVSDLLEREGFEFGGEFT